MPMRPTASNTTATEVLAGLIERVTFHNGENGFCVLRVKARGRGESAPRAAEGVALYAFKHLVGEYG